MIEDYRSRSLWLDGLPEALDPRPGLAGDIDVDVAIVGGGYTGLWTTYYLLRRDPTMRVLVIERDIVGFGASGRNGGWCVGELAAGPERHEAVAGNEAARRFLRELHDSVDEVGRVTGRERISCGFTKGGTTYLARNPAQLKRYREHVDNDRAHYGLTDDDIRLLGPEEAREHINGTRIIGGLHFAHAATVDPAALVRGLGNAVERRGATIVEGTTAVGINGRRVVTDHGTVRADVVVRATEGYTATLRGHRRDLAPLYSLMVATEPLSEEMWQEIGLADRQTFADGRHLVVYGQRTADGRIAFGGRGAPYGFASRISASIERRSHIHDRIVEAMVDLLPQLAGIGITHRWGGVLGVPRDWFPSVGYDAASGFAWSGGYVGEGVAASNLGGRTLADLITGTDSLRVHLPWVGHGSRRWEPEPIRWLEINGALAMMRIADRSEERTGKDSRLARLMWRFLR